VSLALNLDKVPRQWPSRFGWQSAQRCHRGCYWADQRHL